MGVQITEDIFGVSKDPFTKKDTTIRRFTFANDNKVSVQVITLGATITTLNVPDECGKIDDIVLGFDTVEGYQSKENPYFGATIGRVCNRIGYGKFILNGVEINVSKNFNGKHQLHGGFIGFDKAHWIPTLRENDTVVMTHISADGQEGYPGEVQAQVEFTLTSDNCFHVNFMATTTKPTAINMTNHSYFNLAGHDAGSSELYEHFVKIKADKITETDEDSIPTGNLTNITNTAYDLQNLVNLGEKIKNLSVNGFDDNYCVNLDENNKTTVIAKLSHPKSGRWMEVASNQPGVQFYTSNGMPEKNQVPIIGKSAAQYYKHGALCFETQKYPDAVNHENFPSIILNPGETYTHQVIYKFGVCKNDKAVCAQKK